LTTLGYGFQSGYYQQAARNSAQYERWTSHEIGRCEMRLGEAKLECMHRARQAAHENERDEYDLYAQRTSALWASIMAVAALAGIGLSGIGIYLVWTTFDETRRSNEIAERGQRAWLQIEIELHRTTQGEKQVGTHFTATVKNVGSDVASGIQFEATTFRFFAGVDDKCAAFFDARMSDHRPFTRPRALAPGGSTAYRSAVTLPVGEIGNITDTGGAHIYSLLFAAKVEYLTHRGLDGGKTGETIIHYDNRSGAYRYYPGHHIEAGDIKHGKGPLSEAK
jgi:hypothetical protein